MSTKDTHQMTDWEAYQWAQRHRNFHAITAIFGAGLIYLGVPMNSAFPIMYGWVITILAGSMAWAAARDGLVRAVFDRVYSLVRASDYPWDAFDVEVSYE